MSETYDIREDYLFLKNQIFKNTDIIKQIKLYPPVKGVCSVIVIYEVEDATMLMDNGKYLSIDLGLHNLMTCYNSISGETFIVGRNYLSLCHYYNKEISRVQSQWASQQSHNGVKYPKGSKHISNLYKKKEHAIHDYLHKVTRYIVNYCKENDIHTVVIGDITNIRKNNDLGHRINQKLHSLPYHKVYIMLSYKLSLEGIRFVMQKESYSSQTSPFSDKVNKKNAIKSNRVKRGLYKDGNITWNADCIGAYNILRLYFQSNKIGIFLEPLSIKVPYVVKVAV